MFVRVVAPDVVPMLHDVVEQGSHPSTDDGDAGVKQHVDRGIQIAKKPRDLLKFRQSGVFPTQFVSLNKKRGRRGRRKEVDKQWLGFSHLQWGHPSFVNTKLLTNIHWHQYAAKQAKKVNSKCRVVKKLAASSTTNKVPVQSGEEEEEEEKNRGSESQMVDAKTQL